jgi:8-oxo-dGTP diphosphatase
VLATSYSLLAAPLQSSNMKREYPDRPFIGVGAIIVENGRVLLVKRGHAPLAGEWSIPGGVLEVGETLREAAVREVLEETSLVVEPTILLGVYDRILRDTDERTLYHYVLIDFSCRRLSGEAKAAGDAAEVRWFRREEIPGLQLAKDTAEVINLGFEKRAEASNEQK